MTPTGDAIQSKSTGRHCTPADIAPEATVEVGRNPTISDVATTAGMASIEYDMMRAFGGDRPVARKD
jgi:hypothetical protein